MLVEIRKYRIKPGRRDEFVQWFEDEAMPAMVEAGMNILGVFVGEEDEDAFFYLRGFESEEERQRLSGAFYESDLWTRSLRDRALEMEVGYEVSVVRSTGRSPL